ncbi:MAG TPA: hypothetical protein DCE14_02575 [Kosmotogaceae bacterium]|nr:hypothetical protein [Kosmotogaceae bacterium]
MNWSSLRRLWHSYGFKIFLTITISGTIVVLIFPFPLVSLIPVFLSGALSWGVVARTVDRQIDLLLNTINRTPRKTRSLAGVSQPFRQVLRSYYNVLHQLEQEEHFFQKLYTDHHELIDSLNVGVMKVSRQRRVNLANEYFHRIFFSDGKRADRLELSHLLRRIGVKFPLTEGTYEVYSRRVNRRFMVDVMNTKNHEWLITFTDVTAFWKTKKLLEKTRKYAVDSVMVAEFTHSLKQPLANITLALDMYRRTQKDKHLEKLNNEVKLFQDKVRGVLQVFKHGEEPETANLLDIVKRAVRYTEPIASARNVRISLAFSSDANVNVQVRRLENTIKNLILNSIEACDKEGKVTIAVRNRRDTASIYIGDNGRGITEDVKMNLFRPFFTTKEQGTGLGLFSAKHFCDENDVIMKIRGSPGAGCFVSLTFRRTPDEIQSAAG